MDLKYVYSFLRFTTIIAQIHAVDSQFFTITHIQLIEKFNKRKLEVKKFDFCAFSSSKYDNDNHNNNRIFGK